MAPKKLRKEEKVKKAITNEKKEILQTYESGVRVTDLANMYSMSKSTISTILQRKDLYKDARAKTHNAGPTWRHCFSWLV